MGGGDSGRALSKAENGPRLASSVKHQMREGTASWQQLTSLPCARARCALCSARRGVAGTETRRAIPCRCTVGVAQTRGRYLCAQERIATACRADTLCAALASFSPPPKKDRFDIPSGQGWANGVHGDLTSMQRCVVPCKQRVRHQAVSMQQTACQHRSSSRVPARRSSAKSPHRPLCFSGCACRGVDSELYKLNTCTTCLDRAVTECGVLVWLTHLSRPDMELPACSLRRSELPKSVHQNFSAAPQRRCRRPFRQVFAAICSAPELLRRVPRKPDKTLRAARRQTNRE